MDESQGLITEADKTAIANQAAEGVTDSKAKISIKNFVKVLIEMDLKSNRKGWSPLGFNKQAIKTWAFAGIAWLITMTSKKDPTLWGKANEYLYKVFRVGFFSLAELASVCLDMRETNPFKARAAIFISDAAFLMLGCIVKMSTQLGKTAEDEIAKNLKRESILKQYSKMLSSKRVVKGTEEGITRQYLRSQESTIMQPVVEKKKRNRLFALLPTMRMSKQTQGSSVEEQVNRALELYDWKQEEGKTVGQNFASLFIPFQRLGQQTANVSHVFYSRLKCKTDKTTAFIGVKTRKMDLEEGTVSTRAENFSSVTFEERFPHRVNEAVSLIRYYLNSDTKVGEVEKPLNYEKPGEEERPTESNVRKCIDIMRQYDTIFNDNSVPLKVVPESFLFCGSTSIPEWTKKSEAEQEWDVRSKVDIPDDIDLLPDIAANVQHYVERFCAFDALRNPQLDGEKAWERFDAGFNARRKIKGKKKDKINKQD